MMLLHIAGVVCFIVYETAVIVFIKQPFNIVVLLTHYAVDVGWFYLLMFRFFPDISKKKTGLYVKIALYLLCLACFVATLISANQILDWAYKGISEFSISEVLLFRSLWRAIYISIIALCFWYARDRIKKAKELQLQTKLRYNAEKKTLEVENAYLRSQVNPHLLFNSLTYLYKEMLIKLPDASKPVMLLAEMMDYALKPGQPNGMTKLEDEAAHIRRLIAFYQLTDSRAAYLYFHCDIEDANFEVPPLIFNHFIENVLKYGVLDDEARAAVIELNATESIIQFKTRNKVKTAAGKGHQSGLANTQARLEKHYPGKHTLTITAHNDEYLVELILII
ncbi:histidine kinase [Niabella defluvii]|nr:histidine kinase [Niabella sp. I65]